MKLKGWTKERERVRKRLLGMRDGPMGSKIYEPKNRKTGIKIRRPSGARWTLGGAMPVSLEEAVRQLTEAST